MPVSGREWFSFVSDVCSVVGLPSALISLFLLYRQWIEKQRLNQLVSVVLRCTDNKRKITPEIQLRRKYTTRSEVQGVLGTIKMREEGKRYKLEYLNKKRFGDDIESLQDPGNEGDKHNQIVIECSPEEIEQFDPAAVKTMQEWNLFPDVIDKFRKKA